MAKIGEGDPRWLVQDRDDGRNVNGWHWEEKDVTNLTKSELKKRLSALKTDCIGDYALKFNNVEKVDGDATIANRKGKTLFIFDLEIAVKFEATTSDSKKKLKGTLDFAIDLEDCKDFYITISFDGESDDAVRNYLKTTTIPEIKTTVSQWVADMRDTFTKNQANNPKQLSSSQDINNTEKIQQKSEEKNNSVNSSNNTSVGTTKTLTMTIEFRAPKEELFNTIFDSARISGITQSSAKIIKEVGGVFSLFGGSVTGTTTEIVPHTKIVQKWRSSSWPDGLFSTLTLELQNSKEGCTITLKQTGVPENDFDRTETGWKRFYWEPMRMIFGYVNLSSM